MQREYERYLLIKKIRNLYTAHNNYEMDNIIERFLLSLANVNAKKDPILCNDNKECETIYKNLTKQMKEKNIKYNIQTINKTKSLIDEFIKKKPEKYNHKLIVKNNVVIYGDFKYHIDANRLKLLLKKHNNKQYLATMLIRYASILGRGQQWAISLDHIDKFYKKYNVILEAFASPLNSQGIIYDVPFCSIFKDTDEKYGSVGNIFELDIKPFVAAKNKTNVILANPPYIEEIMNKFADLSILWHKKYKIKFVIWVPTWRDAYYYKKMSEIGHVVDYEKNTILLDIYDKNNKQIKIYNKFNLTNFIF